MARPRLGELLRGQQYTPEDDFTAQYTEREEDKATADAKVVAKQARTEVIPTDAQNSKVRVYSPDTSAIDAEFLKLNTHTTIQLPDVLKSLTVIYAKHRGNSVGSETGRGNASGTSGSLSISLVTSSQSSAAIIPDLIPVIERPWQQDVPATRYVFFISDTATRAQILAKVTSIAGVTVNDWPSFHPQAETVTLIGQQTDLTARANLAQAVSFSSDAASWTSSEGTTTSHAVGITLRTVTLPYTIHGNITIDNAATVSHFIDAIATVQVAREGSVLTETVWPARTISTGTVSDFAAGAALPTSLPATPGTHAIPTSGLYGRIISEPWKFGYARVVVEVVNFNIFAP